MALKAVVLWNLFAHSPTASRSHSDTVSEKGNRPEHATDDTQRRSPNQVEAQLQNADGNANRPDNDAGDDDDDVIQEVDIDDIDDDADPDDEQPPDTPRSRRFRRRLSISRTFTTFSTLLDARSIGPPAWVNKFKEFLRPTKSELRFSIPNYRYTPIFSGIVIPFSILLEIPGLTEHWYVQTDNGQTVAVKTNPLLLDIGLAISMACGLIANACLVVRFLEKRVKQMTILCVVFLTIHDILNIAAVAAFGALHRDYDGFTFGQAFWMTICSTVASSFTNITLIVDLIRTPNFAKSGSGLTRRQRTLVVVVIILLCYIAFGALVTSFLMHLTFINALYFCIVTIETVGFGDIVPISTGARLFVCIYACIGILNLGLAVAMTRETVLEALEVSYRKRLKTVRERRRAVRRKRRIERRWREAVEWRLREAGAPIWVKDDFKSNALSDVKVYFNQSINWVLRLWSGSVPQHTHYGYGHHPHGKHLNLEALSRAELEAGALEAGVPLSTLLPHGFRTSDDSSDRPGTPHSGERVMDVMDGITGLWREITTRDERDSCQGPPPTHASIGKMAHVLQHFALAMHNSTTHGPPTPIPESQRSSPVSRNNSTTDAENTNDGDFTNVEQGTTDDGEMKNDDADVDEKAAEQDATRRDDHTPLPARFASPAIASPVPFAVSKLNVSLAPQYDSDRFGLASEEKKAFYAKLTVAWSLFVVFWMVGSAIYTATEGWSYGTSMYFCFIAFTTIGYGDFSPQTPAGRSVFVVWALLGVGTMTILISVITEAYSSRYKNAITTHVFDKAVKRYRHRMRASHPRNHNHNVTSPRTDESIHLHSPASVLSSAHLSSPNPDGQSQAQTAQSDPSAYAQQQLENLPIEILRQTRKFHENVQYFIGPGRGGRDVIRRMPEGLRRLLCDITDAEMIEESIKEEILQDDEARHTLFTLSIEQSLRGIVNVAEDALDAIAERDTFAVLQRNLQEIENDRSRAHESEDSHEDDRSFGTSR